MDSELPKTLEEALAIIASERAARIASDNARKVAEADRKVAESARIAADAALIAARSALNELEDSTRQDVAVLKAALLNEQQERERVRQGKDLSNHGPLFPYHRDAS